MATFFNQLFGDPNAKEIKRLQPLIHATNVLEPKLEGQSDGELRRQFDALKQEIRALAPDVQKAALDAKLPQVFALVRELSKRILGLRHFDEQLIGGIILHQGKIAEMKTGEGKTLVATLPLSLNALTGRGVHLVTPNDYLAKVGAQLNGPLYHALGLTVSAIGQQGQSWRYLPQGDQVEAMAAQVNTDWPELVPCTRAEAYRTDITYGTNNEFGFDYLRDNMVLAPSQLVGRELCYAIVDEVDSILVDEARTPLIISAAAEESADLYGKFATFVERLKPGEDYIVDEKEHHVSMTEVGIGKMEQALGVKNIYEAKTVQLVHHLEEAVRAQALYQRDRNYVVKDGEVIIVDEFTGRLMPGRRYSEGLHQAIEAKEGVEVKQESRTMATITFQNLFRMYEKLAGMTGTAATEAEEFSKIYNLEVVEIPTHRPVVRLDHEDIIYKTEAAKFMAIAEEVKRRTANQQPVLVGTVSIEKSERLSKLLTKSGVKHEVLNAKQHEREAKIIELAGEPGRVTVATNMAGRGVDILLGGRKPGADATKADIAAWEARHQAVLAAGGLAVIGTERHEARRIDNQLRGRSGRQGDPGESQFYVSTEDDLMRIFGGDRLRGMMDRLGLPDDEPIRHKLVTGSLEQAQKRVEGHNFDTRKHLVEYDDVMNQHREVVYRKRHSILELDPASETWLHDEVLDLFHEDELGVFNTKVKTVGDAQFRAIERLVYLRTIDTLWVQHLMTMQHLREGIGLKGYAQRDPLIEYKDAAFEQFQNLKDDIENQVVEMLLKLEIKQGPAPIAIEPTAPQNLELHGADESLAGGAVQAVPPPPVRAQAQAVASVSQPSTSSAPLGSPSGIQVVVRRPGNQPEQRASAAVGASNPYAKVGRNDLCPCGSGKKFKKCHGA